MRKGLALFLFFSAGGSGGGPGGPPPNGKPVTRAGNTSIPGLAPQGKRPSGQVQNRPIDLEVFSLK
jgi:hypothetical protein